MSKKPSKVDSATKKNDELARKLDLDFAASKTTQIIKHVRANKLADIVTKANPPRIALDIASRKYQVYFVDGDTVFNFNMNVGHLDTLLGSLTKGSIVAFEACGASQHLGRMCLSLGLEPHLLDAGLVKGVRGSVDKSDAADATAIYRIDEVLDNEPDGYKKLGIIKSEEEQGLSAIVNQREDAMTAKVAASNQLKSLAREFGFDHQDDCKNLGEFVRKTILQEKSVSEFIGETIQNLTNEILPSANRTQESIDADYRPKAEHIFFNLALDQLKVLTIPHKIKALFLAYRKYRRAIDELNEIDELIEDISNEDERCQRLKAIPGVGPLSSVVLVATLGPISGVLDNASAAGKYVGVVPAHTGTGGKTILLNMSKRGLPVAKRILFQCGMAIISSHTRKQAKTGATSWVLNLLAKGKNKRSVAGAISNKLVRVAFAMLRDDSHYTPELDVHFICKAA